MEWPINVLIQSSVQSRELWQLKWPECLAGTVPKCTASQLQLNYMRKSSSQFALLTSFLFLEFTNNGKALHFFSTFWFCVFQHTLFCIGPPLLKGKLMLLFCFFY